MTEPTNYRVSSGADLNTIFAPLYLDETTTNLVNIYNTNPNNSPTINSSNGYSYVVLEDTTQEYLIIFNTTITTADDLNFIVVGGGSGGRNGSGTRESGGGGGGGFCRFRFNNSSMSHFIATIGEGSVPNLEAPQSGGTTTVNFYPSNIKFIHSTGGVAGERDQPDTNPKRAASGYVLTDSFIGNYGTVTSLANSQGGIGTSTSTSGNTENNGLPSSSPTPQNIVTSPWGETLRFCGGGGGTYAPNGGHCSGARGGNGTGGLSGVTNSTGSTGENGLTWGAGGGAGGCISGAGQTGGSGRNGCVYIYWKNRA